MIRKEPAAESAAAAILTCCGRFVQVSSTRNGMEMVKVCEQAIDRIEKDVLQLTEEGETETFE